MTSIQHILAATAAIGFFTGIMVAAANSSTISEPGSGPTIGTPDLVKQYTEKKKLKETKPLEDFVGGGGGSFTQ